jgi:DNA anti-recombination protein RmuC
MSEQAANDLEKQSKRKAMSEDEQIQKLEEKLKKLREEKRKREEATREKNAKAIMALLKAERLDTVSAEKWQSALEQVKAVLGYEAPNPRLSA